MQLKFNISDSLYEQYVLRFGVQGTYQRMRKVLEEMVNVDPNDRYLMLAGDDRRAIEAVFQTTMDTPERLIKHLKRLNVVSIAGTTMEFTSDELEHLREQASFHGKTLQEFIKDMVSEIKDYMLDRI